ncbi:MAG: vWA domain-containing protein, partial [Gammaproteobacteria bacterium]
MVKPVDIVVLVDESGSISLADLEREREAASLIAQGEFAPDSVISIVGFASEDGPGQSPVDVVCPPTEVGTAQDRQFLSDCVGRLERRAENEGNGTDHAAALGQALNYLTGPDSAGRPKIVFLLTDGVLDVSRSPRYGADNVNDRRNVAARAEIETQLGVARQNNVQIWPLGFGNVDKAQLDRFADGGFQGSCGSNSPSPQAVVVGSSVEVTQQILNAFSAARCAGIGPLDSNQVRPGETIDVTVTIPLIATDGSIIVFKRHPRIGVQYLDPEGTLAPKSGTAKDSTFQVSGENGQVEALRIVNPIPGEWTVRISSPAGVPPLDVGTTVTYLGAVRVSMTTDPPSPQAGQPVAVSLRLATRNRAIVDADILRGFSFSAELSGDGFAPLQVGEFLDNGVGPDVAAGDGVFTGQVTIPATATGALRFVGQVAGVGISGDSREVNTRVVSGASAVRAVAQLPSPDTEV